MKYIIITIVTNLICSAFVTEKHLITDYRDTYVGTYFCKRGWNSLSADKKKFVIHTDTITISVTKDPADSILQFTTGSLVIKAKLINNNLYGFPSGTHAGGYFFSTDSLSFSYSIGMNPNVNSYRGKKN